MLKALSLFLTAIMLLPASASVSNDPPDADIIAPYYIVVDADDPSIMFYGRETDARCIPASTMKIMTCILVLENLKDLDETIVATRQAAGMKDSNSLMHVLAGETLTVRDLLYGMMLVSGNDAALLLATRIAGSIAAFADLANAKAAELGLSDTHFTNASGAFNSKQYSTARDMARLMSYALKNEMFCQLISTVSYTIAPNNVRKEPMVLVNSNRLISDDPSSDCYSSMAFGGKTGSTPSGGDCLVAVGQMDGARVIVVLIGADDLNHRDANKRMPHVFQNGKFLMEYTLENDYALASPSAIKYSFSAPVTVAGLSAPVTLSAQFDEDDGARLPKTLVDQISGDLDGIETATEVSADLANAKTGDVVGTISCSYGGRKLFSGDLIADSDAIAIAAAAAVSAQSTPEPEPTPPPKGILGGAGAGFYIFASLGMLFLATLGLLIFYFFKLKLYKKPEEKKDLTE
jgi:serine-type D-Ala-D-Ala carboxypeptidase (penicillin-binding protein 5/6)